MTYSELLSSPPKVFKVSEISVPLVQKFDGPENVPVYQLPKKDCGLIMIDIVFQAGRPQEKTKMAAASCAALLLEGAGKYSSEEISEELDYLGATVDSRSTLDFITLKAVFIREHLPRIIELMSLIISEPRFDKEDFTLYKQKNKERLKVQMAKNDIKAYRKITEAMYGPDHPYGYNSTPELYDEIALDSLKEHYVSFIHAKNCQIFVAGDIRPKDRKLLDQLCMSIGRKGEDGSARIPNPPQTNPSNITVGGNMHQTSVRIGRRTFVRNHPDFHGLSFLTNILGGYFGSRLITKIREGLGLTYSIYSVLDSYAYDGDLIISTEVANENVGLCIDEIYRQMELLKAELVSEQEIQLAKNYMIGNYLNLFDGPFNSIRAIKSLALAGIPLDNIDSLIKSSLSVGSYQIRDMARKYFDRNDFWTVIVGTPELEKL